MWWWIKLYIKQSLAVSRGRLCVTGMPQCRGDSQLVSGEPTKLVCEVQLAGTFESALSWTRNGADVQSNDGSDIGKALLSVNLNKAGPDDDKAVYQCEMRIADVVEDSCSITLDVACEFTDHPLTLDQTRRTWLTRETIIVPQQIIWSWYTGRWWVGYYIWYSEEGTGRGRSPPRPLLAVSNVTAHPSTASLPITALLHNVQCITRAIMALCDNRYHRRQSILNISSSPRNGIWRMKIPQLVFGRSHSAWEVGAKPQKLSIKFCCWNFRLITLSYRIWFSFLNCALVLQA